MKGFNNQLIICIFFICLQEEKILGKSSEIPKVCQEIIFSYHGQLYFVFDSAIFKPPYLFSIELSHLLANLSFTIEIYSLNDKVLQNIEFYKDEKLTQKYNFENCFIPNTEHNISCKKTAPKLFVLFHDCHDCGLLLFQSSSLYWDNCENQNNVFPFISSVPPKNIKLQYPNVNEICTIFFLIDNISMTSSFYISNIISNNLAALKIYVGTEKILLVEANSNQIGNWQDIPLNSALYAIEIPEHLAIIVNIKKLGDDPIKISNYPFYSLITPPLFGMEKERKLKNYHQENNDGIAVGAKYHITDYEVKARIADIIISSKIQYYFILENGINQKIVYITFLDQEIIFLTNIEFQLFYHCLGDNKKDNCGERNSDLLIYLETIGEKAGVKQQTSKDIMNFGMHRKRRESFSISPQFSCDNNLTNETTTKTLQTTTTKKTLMATVSDKSGAMRLTNSFVVFEGLLLTVLSL